MADTLQEWEIKFVGFGNTVNWDHLTDTEGFDSLQGFCLQRFYTKFTEQNHRFRNILFSWQICQADETSFFFVFLHSILKWKAIIWHLGTI